MLGPGWSWQRLPARSVPVGRGHGFDELAREALELVGLGAGGGGCAFGEAEGGAQAGEGAPAGAPQLGRAQDDQDQVDQGFALRGEAEDVQAVADRGVLDLAQVAVDVQDELVEFGRAGLRVDAEVVMQVGGLDQGPDLGPQRGQLVRVERGHGRVLVEQLLELGHLAVGVGARHRRDQVVDDHRVPAPLGLGPLARVVDDERVHQRQVAEHRVRRALAPTGRAPCLAATPACRACPGARSRRRRSRWPASGRPPGSGATAAGRGRGRSPPGSRRTRAAAGSSARHGRTAGRRARCRRTPRRCTAHPAGRPSGSGWKSQARSADHRRNGGKRRAGPGPGRRGAAPR